MARTGYYGRRRAILEHIEAGKVSLLDTAIHDYLCLTANAVVGNGDLYPAGVTMTSAPAIHAYCPQGISERAVRRSLDHLEKIGWIKRWIVRGKRGNYPVAIARFSVRDLSGREFRVDAENTIDYRNPKLVPVHEASATCPQPVRNSSGTKETRNKKQEVAVATASENVLGEEWKILGVKLPIGSPNFQRFWKSVYSRRNGKSVSVLMEECIQGWLATGSETRKQYVPPPFYEAKRRIEKRERKGETTEDSREMVRARIPA